MSESPRTPRDDSVRHGGHFHASNAALDDCAVSDREPSPLPAEMVEKAVRSHSDVMLSHGVGMIHVKQWDIVTATLEAAGVPALLARIEELTQRCDEKDHAIQTLTSSYLDSVNERNLRIGELEAALARLVIANESVTADVDDAWTKLDDSLEEARRVLGDRPQ